MLNSVDSAISALSSISTSADITAVLEQIAQAAPDPITLDQWLRRVAKATGIGLKPVRQSYDITLKKLNIKPVDLGLALAHELLAEHYNDGIHLRLTKDGQFYCFEESHWKHQTKEKIRAELQAIAVSYKAHTDKPLCHPASPPNSMLLAANNGYHCIIGYKLG